MHLSFRFAYIVIIPLFNRLTRKVLILKQVKSWVTILYSCYFVVWKLKRLKPTGLKYNGNNYNTIHCVFAP